MAVTIKDIAKSVGVSYSTVSKALSDSPLVKAPTKKKIIEVAKELGYQPNAAARSLVSKKTHTIGVIWPSVQREVQAFLITQINDELEKHGYTTLVSINKISQAIHTFQRFQVDAILVFNDQRQIETIDSSSIPLLSYGLDEGTTWPTVDANRLEAIRMAVTYLKERGYEKIQYIGMCDSEYPLQQDKFLGYKAGIAEQFGSKKKLHHLDTVGLNRHDGYLTVKKMLKDEWLPEALIIGSYDLALGTIQALKEDSRPEVKDIVLISYDNLSGLEDNSFPLLYVGVPLQKIVATIVGKLLKMANGEMETLSETLQPELIEPE